MNFNIGKFEITYLKEKVRRLDEFKKSDKYITYSPNVLSNDSIDLLVLNIKKAIESNNYSEINAFDFVELRIGSHIIMEKFSNVWVMERRSKIIKNLD
jgi:hypothetical protein